MLDAIVDVGKCLEELAVSFIIFFSEFLQRVEEVKQFVLL